MVPSTYELNGLNQTRPAPGGDTAAAVQKKSHGAALRFHGFFLRKWGGATTPSKLGNAKSRGGNHYRRRRYFIIICLGQRFHRFLAAARIAARAPSP
jgi:hypothetical protein